MMASKVSSLCCWRRHCSAMSVTLILTLLAGVCVEICQPYTSGFYADNGLHQTVLVDQLPGRDRKAIKQEILTLLGLHHRPRPSEHEKHKSAPSYMMNLYRTLETWGAGAVDDDDPHQVLNAVTERLARLHLTMPGMEKNVDDADMIMSFVNHARDKYKMRHENNKRFYFDFSEVPQDETIMGAELRMYKSNTRKWDVGNSTYRVVLYKVTQGYELTTKTLSFEAEVSLPGDYEGWFDINVTSATLDWMLFPSSNLGLYMKILDNKGEEVEPQEVGLVGRRGAEDKQAFLVTFFQSSPHNVHIRKPRSTRSTRSRGEKKKNKKEKKDKKSRQMEVTYSDDPAPGYGFDTDRFNGRSCRKRTLYVSFRDLGWQEWIIAPEGYSAFYCDGECTFPLNVHMNATNHAIVQTLVHLMDPTAVPKPSCAPTKLSAISVLYFDDNSNVILKKYKNMVVRSCGCH